MSFLHHTVVDWKTILIWFLDSPADFLRFHIIPPIAVHSLEDGMFLIKNILLTQKSCDSAIAEIYVFWDMTVLLAE
jgi:hypothetical protein